MEEKLLYSFEFIVEDIIDEVVKQTDNLKGSASSAEIVFKNRVKIVVEHMDNVRIITALFVRLFIRVLIISLSATVVQAVINTQPLNTLSKTSYF